MILAWISYYYDNWLSYLYIYYSFSIIKNFFFFWWYWGIKISCLLSRHSVYHLNYVPSPFFDLVIFQVGPCFLPNPASDPGPPTCGLLLCCWYHRCEPLHLACLLRWGLTDFLPGLVLNLSPPNFHLLSSWDHRIKQPSSRRTFSSLFLDLCKWGIKCYSIVWYSGIL
jgi:hypothetical protein